MRLPCSSNAARMLDSVCVTALADFVEIVVMRQKIPAYPYLVNTMYQ